MVNLKEFGEMWQIAAEQIKEIDGVTGMTADDNMAKHIQMLPQGSVTLFWLPPVADGRGPNADAYEDRNKCIAFVMEKYDPSRRNIMAVLEDTQIAIEKLKGIVLRGLYPGCMGVRLESTDISTMPETHLFAGFAGWSVAFTLLTPLAGVRESLFTAEFSRTFR